MRLFSLPELWRIVGSRLILSTRYRRIEPDSSLSAFSESAEVFSAPRLFERKKRLRHGVGSGNGLGADSEILFFQTVAPRFGNHIVSLITLHHLTQGYPQGAMVNVLAPKWSRGKSASWRRGAVTVSVGNSIFQGSWPNRVLIHNTYFLPESALDFSEAAEAARMDIWRMLDIPTRGRDEDSAASDVLTIHIRGGDIFAANPHPEYTPPPLAFYVEAISSAPWRSIAIVREDDNPLARALIAWLVAEGLRWSVNTPDFDQDFALLTSARNLVAGHGTFLPTIAYLSDKIDRVYAFTPELFSWMRPRSATVIPMTGDWEAYKSLMGEWKAEPWQITLATTWNMG